MASVVTYSPISSRKRSSSAWSTLMTSSIRRSISLAKRVLICWVPAINEDSCSEDLGTVVVLGLEHAHEPKARGAVEHARVEEDSWCHDPALQLLEQREGPVDR